MWPVWLRDWIFIWWFQSIKIQIKVAAVAHEYPLGQHRQRTYLMKEGALRFELHFWLPVLPSGFVGPTSAPFVALTLPLTHSTPAPPGLGPSLRLLGGLASRLLLLPCARRASFPPRSHSAGFCHSGQLECHLLGEHFPDVPSQVDLCFCPSPILYFLCNTFTI